VLIPQAAVMMVCAPLSSVWVAKIGNKIVVAGGLLLVSISLVLFDTFQVHISAVHLILVTALMGVGMANVIAPCTDSIMGSLPRAKAGVGSAVNDTTRQMGGAIGVAVFGSLMASHFTSTVGAGLRGAVPPTIVTQIGDNIGQAVGVATETPAAKPYATQILDVAKHGFVSGLHTIGFVAAGVVLLAAIGVALFLPARARVEDPSPDEPVEELQPQTA
jgi:hypothetical protein